MSQDVHEVWPIGKKLVLFALFPVGYFGAMALIAATGYGDQYGAEVKSDDVAQVQSLSSGSSHSGGDHSAIQQMAAAEAKRVATETARSVATEVATQVAKRVARDEAQLVAREAAQQAIADAN